nr:transcriptional regulator [Arthrobacter sp. MYb227]
MSDSALSKHLRVLENAGYVSRRKGIVDTRTRTWISLTKSGRGAFRTLVGALRALAASADIPDSYN